jgi:hypothetical protein
MFLIVQPSNILNGVFPFCPILKIQVKNTFVTVGIVFIGVLIKDQTKLPIVRLMKKEKKQTETLT